MSEEEKRQRTYFCIDMKSFFASVECAERGLNPFETNLVVADASRGRGALCLAVTPRMKDLGVRNRCRLYEIPPDVSYEIARPRMKKYIEYAADIYELYLGYFSEEDIHTYSIDESFIDATPYIKIYGLPPRELAKKLINEIAGKVHIPATAGIGTNLYLAKIALDISAKTSPDHIGFLTEDLYRKTLWTHRPITDFWQVAKGTAERLARFGIYDMKGVAEAPEDLMYRTFGVNAELLMDHARGRESCTMADIKAYRAKSRSVSTSQILFEDYSYEKAQTVMSEMVLAGCQELMRRGVITNRVGIGVGYSGDAGEPTGGSVRMKETTNVYSVVNGYAGRLFAETTRRDLPIRRLSLSFDGICDDSCEGYDIFTDFDAVSREKRVERAVLDAKDRFGKNAVLRASDLQEGATAIMRNKLIGGHNSE